MTEEPIPRLYGFWLSPYMSLVANVLTEAGVEFAYERVSTLTGENRNDAYQTLNPIGKVPTFVDADGTVVTESLSICRYLSRCYPQARAIYPVNDPKACAKIDAISDFLTFHIIGPYFNWFIVTGHFPIAWGLKTENESKIFGLWSIFLVLGELQRLLDSSNLDPYFCGTQPTLPDYQLFYLLEHGRVLSELYNLPELNFLNDNDTLGMFYDAMAARPSTRQILQSRAVEFAQNSRELLTEMKPAYEGMLTGARGILSNMFGHPV